MTAALGNTAQGTPFATGVDAFVYPQFIGYALRAPTTQDIYNPGTRWQDNSVSPPVIYETSGAGRWLLSTSGGAGIFSSLIVTPGPISLTGTTTINTSGAAATTIGTGGTGPVNIGNATGNTAVTGTLTSSAGITATTGNLTATAGNLALNGVTSKIIINASAPATASVGTTGAMIAGVVTITTSAITASSKVYYTRRTLGTAMGNVSITAQGVGSAELTSDEATETSTFDYIIVN